MALTKDSVYLINPDSGAGISIAKLKDGGKWIEKVKKGQITKFLNDLKIGQQPDIYVESKEPCKKEWTRLTYSNGTWYFKRAKIMNRTLSQTFHFSGRDPEIVADEILSLLKHLNKYKGCKSFVLCWDYLGSLYSNSFKIDEEKFEITSFDSMADKWNLNTKPLNDVIGNLPSLELTMIVEI